MQDVGDLLCGPRPRRRSKAIPRRFRRHACERSEPVWSPARRTTGTGRLEPDPCSRVGHPRRRRRPSRVGAAPRDRHRQPLQDEFRDADQRQCAAGSAVEAVVVSAPCRGPAAGVLPVEPSVPGALGRRDGWVGGDARVVGSFDSQSGPRRQDDAMSWCRTASSRPRRPLRGTCRWTRCDPIDIPCPGLGSGRRALRCYPVPPRTGVVSFQSAAA